MRIFFSPSHRQHRTVQGRFVLAATQTIAGFSVLSVACAGWAQSGVPLASRATAEVVYSGPLYVPGEVLVGVLPRERGTLPRSRGTAPAATGSGAAESMSKRLFSAAAIRKQVETIAGGAQTVSQNAALGTLRLRVKGETVEQVISRLQASGQVSYAEPNYIRYAFSTPSDTYFTSNQWGPQKVSAPQAWDIYNPQVQTVIAIIDTGVTLNHPDLVNKILKDGSGNVVGYNFVANNTNPADDHGHGTHCAGIAAAQINNGVGVAGIAGWNGLSSQTDVNSTKIMPLKVLAANGSGYDSDVANAIVWAADHGARVISMSLGGANVSQTLNNAVSYAIGKNCVVVAAAGNSNSSAYSYPGACSGVLSVASSDPNDTLSGFSNYGPWVTVAAPGSNILSTWFDPASPYAFLSGTSMATPLVAGEVALLASQKPTLTSAQLFALIQNNTDAVAPSGGKTISGGRVNVYKALFAATLASLTAPANLLAQANSRSTITLTWADTTTTEDGFSVELSTDGGTTFAAVGTVGMDKTTTTVSGLSRSTTYSFRLRAFSGTTMGAYSNVTSAKTKAF